MECRATGFVVVKSRGYPIENLRRGEPIGYKKGPGEQEIKARGKWKQEPLKLTAILHLKMDVWNKTFLLDPFGKAYFHKFVGVQRALG